MFHGRCKDVETALQAQIVDLQERLRESAELTQKLYDNFEHTRETYERQLQELHELLFALQNPGALRAVAASRRSAQPAPTLPQVEQAQAPRVNVNYPRARTGGPSVIRRDAVVPRLTPEGSRFRPTAPGTPRPPVPPSPIELERITDALAAEHDRENADDAAEG